MTDQPPSPWNPIEGSVPPPPYQAPSGVVPPPPGFQPPVGGPPGWQAPQQPGGWQQPMLAPKKSSIGIWAVVLGVVGILSSALIVVPVIAIIVGLVGTFRSGAHRKMSIIGLILGVVGLIAGIAIDVFLVSKVADEINIETGECVEVLEKTPASAELDQVPCDSSHDGQVVAVFDLPNGAYPGIAEVERSSEAQCAIGFTTFIGISPLQSQYELLYIYPTEARWPEDRQVVCVVKQSVGQLPPGSLQGVAR